MDAMDDLDVAANVATRPGPSVHHMTAVPTDDAIEPEALSTRRLRI